MSIIVILSLPLSLSLLLSLLLLSLLDSVEEIVIAGGKGVAIDTDYLKGIYNGGGVAEVPTLAPLLTPLVS